MTHPPDREVAVFNAALQLPAGRRAAYLEQACVGDAALRLRVEALLGTHEEVGAFLENPTREARPAPAAAKPPGPGGTIRMELTLEKTGDRIGRYKLLQQIGEGGCGVVYMAEQSEPVRRKVALKVIKLGMDTKHVIARFEAERQALALMDHPNIAKVLDAGATDTGRPFFVMELVRGIKITEYCDQNQLATRERLKLFTQVCQAIQHAHQKGVIHRDIKPSNILVADHDGVPVPKVIDFGIAKATTDQPLTDKTLFTALEQFMGTPAYMSPEQARMSGLDIDTRTDIYSLGVLLYELLTGKTPFDARDLLASGLEEMRRTIREEEPARPSTRLSTMMQGDLATVARHRCSDAPKLVHLVRGDLDWIVMKALEKDRVRRYETANGLAMDVKRYLASEPVVARPPSNVYRFQKLVHRNKLGFIAASVVAAVLVLGAVMSTWQAIRATRAERAQTHLRQEAEQARNNEAKLRTQAQADEKKAQTEVVKSQQVAQFLKEMLNGVGPSVARGRDTTMLREILDKTAERVATGLKEQPEVQAELVYTLGEVYWALGDLERAEAMHRRALELRQRLFGNEHSQAAQSMRRLGQVLWRRGKLAEGEGFARRAVATQRKLLGNEHLELAASLKDLAVFASPQEAELVLREALAIQRKGLGPENAEVADSLGQLASLLDRQGSKRAKAEAPCREALAIDRKLFGPEHPSVAGDLNVLGQIFMHQGKLAEAEAALVEALAIRKKLLGDEHPDVAQSLGRLGELRSRQGSLQEAESLWRRALAIQRKLLGEENAEVPESLLNLARLLVKQGRLPDAEKLLDESLAIRKRVFGREAQPVAVCLHWLGIVLFSQPKLPEANSALSEAVNIFTKSNGHESVLVAGSLYYLGRVWQAEGKLAEAEGAFRDVVAIRTKVLGAAGANAGDSLNYLGEVLRAQGRLAEAAAAYRQAANTGHILAQQGLARAYQYGEGVARDGAEALKWYRKAAASGDATALNQLARFLATAPEPEVRDASAAVTAAETLVAKTGRRDAGYLDTLAAAYAEAGRFTNAVRVQQEALGLVQTEPEKQDYDSRLKLYEHNSPYRDAPVAKP